MSSVPEVSEPGVADTVQSAVEKIGELHLRINKLDAEIRVLQLFAQDHYKRILALEEHKQQEQPVKPTPPAAPVAAKPPMEPPPELVEELGTRFRDYRITVRQLIVLAYKAGRGEIWLESCE